MVESIQETSNWCLISRACTCAHVYITGTHMYTHVHTHTDVYLPSGNVKLLKYNLYVNKVKVDSNPNAMLLQLIILAKANPSLNRHISVKHLDYNKSS